MTRQKTFQGITYYSEEGQLKRVVTMYLLMPDGEVIPIGTSVSMVTELQSDYQMCVDFVKTQDYYF